MVIQLGQELEVPGQEQRVVLALGGDQRVVGVLGLEVHHDGERLHDDGLTVLPHGDLSTRVDGKELGSLVGAVEDVDLFHLRLQALLVGVDRHAPGVVGERKGVQDLLLRRHGRYCGV